MFISLFVSSVSDTRLVIKEKEVWCKLSNCLRESRWCFYTGQGKNKVNIVCRLVQERKNEI